MMPSTSCGYYGAPEQICSGTVVSVISVERFYTRHCAAGKFSASQIRPKIHRWPRRSGPRRMHATVQVTRDVDRIRRTIPRCSREYNRECLDEKRPEDRLGDIRKSGRTSIHKRPGARYTTDRFRKNVLLYQLERSRYTSRGNASKNSVPCDSAGLD